MRRVAFCILVAVVLAACTQDGVSLRDTNWRCEKRDATRSCLVAFTIKNNSDFLMDAKVKMRAYARIRVGDAISIETVGEDELQVGLSPGEERRVRHTMTIDRKFTQIVVSAFPAR